SEISPNLRAGTSTRSGKQCRFHPQSYCGGKTAQDSEFHPGRHSNPRTRSPSHVLVIEQMLSELLCKLLLPLLDSLHRVIHCLASTTPNLFTDFAYLINKLLAHIISQRTYFILDKWSEDLIPRKRPITTKRGDNRN